MRIQRGRVGYTRIPVAGRVEVAIEKAIARTAERFQCSRSFVISVACADFFGIETERYNKPRREQIDMKDKQDSVVQFRPKMRRRA